MDAAGPGPVPVAVPVPCPARPRRPPSSRRSQPRRAYRLGACEGRHGVQQQPQGRTGGRDWGEDHHDEEERQGHGQPPRPRARHSPAATAPGLPGSDLGAGRGRPSPEEGPPRGGA